MKCLCRKVEYDIDRKVWTYTFKSLETEGIYLRDSLMIDAEKPVYNVGQEYDCRIDFG